MQVYSYGTQGIWRRSSRADVHCNAQTPVKTSPSVAEAATPTVTLTTLQALERDIPNSWKYGAGQLDPALFSDDIRFKDPVASISGFAQYRAAIELLRLALADLKYTQSNIWQSAIDQVTTRWTIRGKLAILPWNPCITISGSSVYTIGSDGKITDHVETWDSVDNQSPLSAEAVVDIARQAGNILLTPDLESPPYEVLARTQSYEIRRYDPYVVAQVAQKATSVTSARGFNDLASYIFGGNQRQRQMSMTTPVITTSSGDMQFPMERTLGSDPEALPAPNNAEVMRRKEEGGLVGVATFSGWPLDGEVVEAEAKLRNTLLAAGLDVKEGYSLLRYNEPYVPPFLRRNEVVIAVEEPEEGWKGVGK